MTETTKKKVSKVMFSVCFSFFYNMMTYVQELTVLRLGCGLSNVSAGQWETGEEGQMCTILRHWDK